MGGARTTTIGAVGFVSIAPLKIASTLRGQVSVEQGIREPNELTNYVTGVIGNSIY